jgi:hypothetical protein
MTDSIRGDNDSGEPLEKSRRRWADNIKMDLRDRMEGG